MSTNIIDKIRRIRVNNKSLKLILWTVIIIQDTLNFWIFVDQCIIKNALVISTNSKFCGIVNATKHNSNILYEWNRQMFKLSEGLPQCMITPASRGSHCDGALFHFLQTIIFISLLGYLSLVKWLRGLSRMGPDLPFKCIEICHLHNVEFSIKTKTSFFVKKADKKITNFYLYHDKSVKKSIK